MTRNFAWFLVGVALITVLAWSMGGCASSGLFAMSDQWCDTHPNASAAHCARQHKQISHDAPIVITVDCKGPVSVAFGDSVYYPNTPEWQTALFALYYAQQQGQEPTVSSTCKEKK